MPLNHGVGDHGLLRGPWTARSNQSILKEVNPEYSLQGLMPKLKLEYFGHLMWRVSSLEKTLTLGKTEGRRMGQQKMDGITDMMDVNGADNRSWMASLTWWTWMELFKLWEILKDREAWHAAVYGVTKSQMWLSDWTTVLSSMEGDREHPVPVMRDLCI